MYTFFISTNESKMKCQHILKFSEINGKNRNEKLSILQEFKDFCRNVIDLIKKKLLKNKKKIKKKYTIWVHKLILLLISF